MRSILPSPATALGIGLGTETTSLASVPIYVHTEDKWLEGSFDSYFHLENLPTDPPNGAAGGEQSFVSMLNGAYPYMPTPQTSTPSSAASSSGQPLSVGGFSPVGDSRPRSVGSCEPTPNLESIMDLVISAANTPTPHRQQSKGRCTTAEKGNSDQAKINGGNPSDDAGRHRNRGSDHEKSEKGWISTIHIAVQSGNERILNLLLQQDADAINSRDSDGRTPLFHGAIQDNESVVRLLLGHGARVGVVDVEGRSPLHWAVLHRRPEVLQALLEHWGRHEKRDFDIDAYDNVGWTPLHLAVERRFEEGVRLLMKSGASIKAKAKCPHTGNAMAFNVEPM